MNVMSLEDLPLNILENIFNFLKVTPFIYLSNTSKYIKQISTNLRFLQNAEARSRQIVYKAIIRRESFLISGPGGVGKSYILRKLYHKAKKQHLTIGMTAPTGIAAINLEAGKTIHSYSNLGLATISLNDIRMHFNTRTSQSYKWRNIWLNTDILVIDEISMIGASLFEKVELCARLSKGIDRPFGDIQVIFCGDFHQLPPVKDKFVFTTNVWQEMRLQMISLTTPIRHRNDLPWFNLLNRVRIGDVSDYDAQTLSKRITNLDTIDLLTGEFGCILVPTNKEAKSHNTLAFDINQFEITKRNIANDRIFEYIYDNGSKQFIRNYIPHIDPVTVIDKIENRLMKIPKEISFKHGALYVMNYNIDTDEGLVNGLMCRFDAERGRSGLMIDFKGNELPEYALNPISRDFHIYGNLHLTRRQVPFCLGYALTIHSSQGMTLSNAVVNCGESIFTSAQTYVALSRISTIEGLTLLGLDVSKITSNQEATLFYSLYI